MKKETVQVRLSKRDVGFFNGIAAKTGESISTVLNVLLAAITACETMGPSAKPRKRRADAGIPRKRQRRQKSRRG